MSTHNILCFCGEKGKRFPDTPSYLEKCNIWFPCIFQALENDVTALDDQIKTIVEKGQALADAGHFDRAGILKAVDSFHKR